VLRRPLSLWLAPWLAASLACGSAPSAPAPAPRPDLAASLIWLGKEALDAGDLTTASERFARALAADPGSLDARIGLGRVALAQGDLAGAQQRFAEAQEHAPDSVDARLGLARVAAREGRSEQARTQLDLALAADPWRAETHAELAALTGRAPRGPADLDEAVRRAQAHPYDVAAGLAAGTALAAAGRNAEAAHRLEAVLWLADLDRRSARKAWDLLARIDPAWRAWRAVNVHSYADESMRGRPDWPFRVRLAWLATSRTLGPLLEVRFLPASVQAFSSRDASDALVDIEAAFRAQTLRAPAEGVLAAFTARAAPRGRADRLGQAEFLGRRLVVRLDDAPGPSHTLIHELLHLYGGVHVAEGVESLMNPSGGALVLDPLNAHIVREIRARGFRGNLDADVLDVIDLEATTRAYEDALRANLAFRRAGIAEALRTTSSRLEAQRAAARILELDPHLGDVARFVALLLWRNGKPASAAFLLETASRLYGPSTANGRKAAGDAERIWREILPGGGSKG
jgi:tetratricopeptide (TPR) repeat protein